MILTYNKLGMIATYEELLDKQGPEKILLGLNISYILYLPRPTIIYIYLSDMWVCQFVGFLKFNNNLSKKRQDCLWKNNNYLM